MAKKLAGIWRDWGLELLVGLGALVGLVYASEQNYLLFHTLAEGFSIVVAGAFFALTWNTWKMSENGYLQWLGIAFLFVAGLDGVHTLAYKGMGVFPGYDANLPTQLWIATRYLQALTFFAAPAFLRRKMGKTDRYLLVGVYAIVTAALAGLIFARRFPDCYVEGRGLTPFKIVSEYVISLLLIVGLWRLYRRRKSFPADIFRWLVAAIVFTVVSELAFTFYVSVYGLSNLVGHIFKILAFYCIYHAIIETGLRRPYALLFREVQQRNEQLDREIATLERTEQELRATEENLRTTLNSIGDAVIATDTEGQVVRMNPTAERLTGWDESAAKGHPLSKVFNIVNAKTGEEAHDPVQKVLDEGEIVGLANHTMLIAREGTRYQIADSAAPIENDEGRVTGVVLVFRDVTEEYETRQALRESEEKYDQLFENMPSGVAVYEPVDDGEDFVFVDFNEAAEALDGVDRERVIGKRVTTAFPGVRDLGLLDVFRTVWKTGEPMYHPAGLYEDERIAGWRENWVYKLPSGLIVAVYNDITDRKRAQEAMQASEEQYRSLFDSIRDAILVADTDWNIIDCNPAFRDLFGYSLEEIAGKSMLHVYESEAEYEQLEQALKEDTGDPDFLVTIHYQKKSGEIFPGETSIFYRRNDEGKVTGLVGVIRDITARKKMERELRQQEQLAAVGQLAAGIAHDFRNVLATILLYAEMDSHDPTLPTRVTDHLRVIVDESNRATNLIQQILDFSGRAMIEMKSIDLASFVAQRLEVLRRTIPESVQISLETKPSKDLPEVSSEPGSVFTVRADPARLQQVLMNLALNARDAMQEGGILKLTLSRMVVTDDDRPPVAEMEPGTWVCLAVSDTGHGMTEKVREHLFEPFFTTKDVDKGTGLGLAQVYGIVRQHEGVIDVETAPGEGTTFRIYLPAYEEQPAEATDGDRSRIADAKGRGETVLLVEDNEVLRDAAQSILQSAGYEVVSAEDGRDALALWASPRWSAPGTSIDLVVTDVVMPHLSGKALMRELSRSHPHVRAVGMTGYGVETVIDDLEKLGFVDVIHKPFDAERLLLAVRNALDSHGRL